MARTLKDLPPGETAKILKITGMGEARRRILDMGITKGTSIKMVKAAPLGDPIDIIVKGYHLSLRKEDASSILVTEEG